MLKNIIYLTILLSCFSWPATAENRLGTSSISLLRGQQSFEGNQSLDTSGFWGVGLGFNMTEHWSIEGLYTRTNATAGNASASDTKSETYRLDTLYHLWPERKFSPYVAAGLGAKHDSPDTGSDREGLLFNYGVGIKYFILDDLIALRADIRHLLDFSEPDNSLQYSAGLIFQLGRATQMAE